MVKECTLGSASGLKVPAEISGQLRVVRLSGGRAVYDGPGQRQTGRRVGWGECRGVARASRPSTGSTMRAVPRPVDERGGVSDQAGQQLVATSPPGRLAVGSGQWANLGHDLKPCKARARASVSLPWLATGPRRGLTTARAKRASIHRVASRRPSKMRAGLSGSGSGSGDA
ncbi:hypothetical protein COCC4DRAFT_19313 [Bipolaris maydis ATCC 48331]|uniref:Uncharacterized protein n=2 Tax=Cochliobolus heterostrophus TaxID=5016 RepID=M2UPY9_COCH5|nr:uncharacterized protein COCC4DRAFT_19313 [Bipolaris maydis ATCC 48331]EMD89993.1 hypothetical protein COCHEDRAFT_1031358 [Bipolaris maydis C5]ENI09794.1 hypothetical protein COCC4DRAFT_19313 [Bipolaris maydis ATCC 48331]